jgi:hypothetical protein
MPLNGKFLAKYGKTWLTMDDGEKWMAVMSEIFDLREQTECLPKVTKTVDHLKWTGIGLGIVLSALWTLFTFHVFGK